MHSTWKLSNRKPRVGDSAHVQVGRETMVWLVTDVREGTGHWAALTVVNVMDANGGSRTLRREEHASISVDGSVIGWYLGGVPARVEFKEEAPESMTLALYRLTDDRWAAWFTNGKYVAVYDSPWPEGSDVDMLLALNHSAAELLTLSPAFVTGEAVRRAIDSTLAPATVRQWGWRGIPRLCTTHRHVPVCQYAGTGA